MARKPEASTEDVPDADGYLPAKVHLDELDELRAELDKLRAERAGNTCKVKNILGADGMFEAALSLALKLRKKRGRSQKHPWGEIRAETVRRILPHGRPVWPKSEPKFIVDIAQWCSDNLKNAPAPSELHAMVTALLKVLHRLLD